MSKHAEALASLVVLANEIENPRIQRPGMQRRREWAKRIDRCVADLAAPQTTTPTDTEVTP